jgi:Fic family protein
MKRKGPSLAGSTDCKIIIRFPEYNDNLTERRQNNDNKNRLQVEDRTARRHLNRFVELGLVSKTGSGPSTEYEVI